MKLSPALRFNVTRTAHQHELAEDYVEIILELSEKHGAARLLEIAARLGVAHPTAAKSLKKLQRDGLVIIEPYRSVALTPKGKRLAAACKKRHQVVVEFLLALGIDKKTAETDAEGIEHHVSPQTLAKFEEFTLHHR